MAKKNEIKPEENRNVHANHRSRLRDRLKNEGLANFQDHNVLELLLFYGMPRKDTNEIAHELMLKFGSLPAVLEASPEALMQVKGVGPEIATLISFIIQLLRYYEACKTKDKKTILNSDEARKYLANHFIALNYEKFVIMYLDGRGGLIKVSEITQGSDSMVNTDFSAILKSCVLLDAKGIVIAHNHPDGFAVPSKEDKVLTEKLSALCKTLNIVLCEHIIFSGNEYCYLSKTRGVKAGTCAF